MASSLNGTGITFSNGQTQSSSAIGDDGQSWQDVSASRAIGTTYTNSTGRPIEIFIARTNASQFTQFYLTINGGSAINVWRNPMPTGTGGFYAFSAVIPNGSTYSVTGGSISRWYELR